jgi:hypothetical protein
VSVDSEEDEESFHFGTDCGRGKRRPETEKVGEHAEGAISLDLEEEDGKF